MGEIIPKQSEINVLLSSQQSTEQKHGSQPVGEKIIKEIYGDICNLHKIIYGSSIEIPITILPPVEESRKYLGDTIPIDIPRGNYSRPVAPQLDTERTKIVGIQSFYPPSIYLIQGNPDLVNKDNFRGVFRWILSHEYIHGQTIPKKVIGINPPPLTPKEINIVGNIHYITGFKAVTVMTKGSLHNLAHTRLLDEFITQYLTMNLYDAFNRPDPIIESIKQNGNGISSEYIIGAEILNFMFTKIGISPLLVSELHSQSDIRGFINLMDKTKAGLGRKIIAYTATNNSKEGVAGLMILKKELSSKTNSKT